MVVPDYQSLMFPLLIYAGDSKEHRIRNAIEDLAEELGLSEEERKVLLPSGQQAVFSNRVAWANTYLKKAGLLESRKKGYFTVTQKGLSVLRENPVSINVNFLTRYEEFNEFRRGKKAEIIDLDKSKTEAEQLDPRESLEVSYQQLHNELVLEILSITKKCSSSFLSL